MASRPLVLAEVVLAMIFTKADRQDLQNIPAMLSALRIRLETLASHDKLIIGALGVLENNQGRLLTALKELLDAIIKESERGEQKRSEFTVWRRESLELRDKLIARDTE